MGKVANKVANLFRGCPLFLHPRRFLGEKPPIGTKTKKPPQMGELNICICYYWNVTICYYLLSHHNKLNIRTLLSNCNSIAKMLEN